MRLPSALQSWGSGQQGTGESKLLCRSTNGAWGFDVIRETIRENRSSGDGAGRQLLQSHPWVLPPTWQDEVKSHFCPFCGWCWEFLPCLCSQEGLVAPSWVLQSLALPWSWTCCTQLGREMILVWVLDFPELRQQLRALPAANLIPTSSTLPLHRSSPPHLC